MTKRSEEDERKLEDIQKICEEILQKIEGQIETMKNLNSEMNNLLKGDKNGNR